MLPFHLFCLPPLAILLDADGLLGILLLSVFIRGCGADSGRIDCDLVVRIRPFWSPGSRWAIVLPAKSPCICVRVAR